MEGLAGGAIVIDSMASVLFFYSDRPPPETHHHTRLCLQRVELFIDVYISTSTVVSLSGLMALAPSGGAEWESHTLHVASPWGVPTARGRKEEGERKKGLLFQKGI